MALDQYAEDLEQLGPTPTGQATSPLAGALRQVLDEEDQQQRERLKVATAAVADTSPDRAAEVARLARRIGSPASFVERNFEAVKKHAAAEDAPVERMLEQTPALAAWASDPSNQAVAKDDLEQLGFLEWIVKAVPRAEAQSIHQMRLASLRTKQLLVGTLSQEEQDQLNAEKYHAELGGRLGAGDSWFRGAITGGAQLLENIVYGFISSGKRATFGAGVGGTIGGIAGFIGGGGVGAIPGAVAGAKFGAGTGALVGGFEFGAELEAGLAYDEFLTFRDEHGQPIDRDVARGAALAAGALNGGLEVIGLGILAKSIPGLKQLKGALARNAIKTALRNPTIRAALGEAVKSYGETVLGESAVEVAQRAVTILAGELGKAASGQDMLQRTPQDILEDLAREGAGALQGFAFIPVPGAAGTLAHGAWRAKQAQQGEAFFTALGEGASQSKTIQRLPAAAQAFLEQATKDGPVEHLYAPVEAFTQYWQSVGLDPAKVAAELTGETDALEQAQRTGVDLKIPTARYAVQLAGTEHHAALSQELRLGPDAMNAREAREFQADLEQRLAADPEALAAAAPEASPVRDAVLAQLAAAGVPQQTAEAYATLYDAAFGAMAARAGVDSAALYARYGLRVQRPDLAAATGAAPAVEGETSLAQRIPTALADVLGAGGFAGPEQRQASGEAPEGVERRALVPTAQGESPVTPVAGSGGGVTASLDPDAPIDLTDPVAAAAQMLAENPRILQEAAALRARAAETRAQKPRGAIDAILAPPIPEAPTEPGAEAPTSNEDDRTFSQTDRAPERRGALTFGADRQMTIALFARADLSTFLHESGHFFLEVMGDLADQLGAADPATLTDPQRRLQADYQALLTWFGAADRAGIGTTQHEQFARAFEAYLMEGKAPSIELRSVFARFRAWLTGVYRTLRGLDVPLTQEVRRVFDRLLATDAAIAAAEAQGRVDPMFTTAESAGLSPDAFDLYRATVAKASQTAHERLDQRLLADVQREQTAAWQEARDAIETQVRDELGAQPVYRALVAIRKGTAPDGTPLVEGAETPEPLKLSRAILVERYGADRLRRLPKPYVYAVDGGLDPDAVAQLFGFATGDDLLVAIEQADPFRQAVKQETDQRMLAQHGSLLLDGTLQEEAQAALTNEDREAVIRAELRALAGLRRTVAPFVRAERQQGRAAVQVERARTAAAEADLSAAQAASRSGAAMLRAAVPPQALFREAARAQIGRTRVRDLDPRVFWWASRRAAQQAFEAAARQDFDAAITAKQQELLNLELHRAATAARENADAIAKHRRALAKPAAMQRVGKAGEMYFDQIYGILDRYEFATIPKTILDRRARIDTFVKSLEAQQLPVDLPVAVLDDARRVNYRDLTYDELVGVDAGIAQILHLVRLKTRLLKAADERDLARVTGNIGESIRAQNPARRTTLEFDAGAVRRHSASKFFAALAKVSTLARTLDGHEPNGPMAQAFVRPLNAAADWETARKQEEGRKYWAIVRASYSPTEIAQWHRKTFIPAIGGSLSTRARLAVALNWGTQSNRDRLLADPVRRWTQDQVLAILDTLDKRDLDFVQATWDYNEAFRPEIGALEKRMKGVEPEWVEATAIETRFGTYRGGYYHLAYDRRLARGAAQIDALDALDQARAAAYVSSTTRQGHLKARADRVALPLELDLGVQFRHIDQVVHDLAYRETLFDLNRILRSSEVSSAIYETRGDVFYEQFQDVLEAAANGLAQPHNVWERGATWMRTGTQIAALGLNFWTAAQQSFGLLNAMAQIGTKQGGPKWVLRGLAHWLGRDLAHVQGTTRWITEVSPFMNARSGNATQDLSDVRAALLVPGGWFDAQVQEFTGGRVSLARMVDAYMYPIVQMQRVADIPTWLAGYEKAIAEGLPEAEAIAAGDQLVRDAQGSAQIHDLAQVQRGGPVARLFMMFYAYGNTLFNTNATILGRTHFGRPGDVAAMVGDLALANSLPALLTVALGHAFGKEPEDDLAGWLGDVGWEVLGTAMNTVVGLRELGGLTKGGTRGYAGPAGTRLFQAMYEAARQVAQGEADEALWRSLNSVAGMLFRYPAVQVQKTIDGVAALSEGETTNPGAVLVGPPRGVR